MVRRKISKKKAIEIMDIYGGGSVLAKTSRGNFFSVIYIDDDEVEVITGFNSSNKWVGKGSDTRRRLKPKNVTYYTEVLEGRLKQTKKARGY